VCKPPKRTLAPRAYAGSGNHKQNGPTATRSCKDRAASLREVRRPGVWVSSARQASAAAIRGWSEAVADLDQQSGPAQGDTGPLPNRAKTNHPNCRVGRRVSGRA
jgi:hypothetical protein